MYNNPLALIAFLYSQLVNFPLLLQQDGFLCLCLEEDGLIRLQKVIKCYFMLSRWLSKKSGPEILYFSERILMYLCFIFKIPVSIRTRAMVIPVTLNPCSYEVLKCNITSNERSTNVFTIYLVQLWGSIEDIVPMSFKLLTLLQKKSWSMPERLDSFR